MAEKQAQWSSYWGFILATAGAAVGLGNIWKFPYIAGENGGGAFVLIYLVCIVIIGVPLMMAEIMLGRRAGGDPKTSMSTLAAHYKASPLWAGLGYMLILAGFLILSYYSVIAGWASAYVFKSGMGMFTGETAAQIDQLFSQFIHSPYELAFWHTVMIAATIFVVAMGVEKGLERAVIYMFPAMLALLLVIVGYSMGTGFFGKGLNFLFYPDLSELSAHGVLVAVGHAFFTLSLATGSIMMYGAYLPKNISIPKASIYIAIADTLIALLAGLAIFPIVFAHGLQPGAGPGLIFKSLPLAFGHMPYGTFFGTLFFVMLVFAAFTSAISLLEPSVAWTMKRLALSRTKAAILVGVCIWLLGFATVFSFNIWQDITILGLNCFDFLDSLTSNYMLPIGGLFIALFSAWVMKDSYDELALDKNSQVFKLWRYSLGIITPIAIILVFLSAIGVLNLR
jgi:NSS family neurotransmitter:Na+ symporter